MLVLSAFLLTAAVLTLHVTSGKPLESAEAKPIEDLNIFRKPTKKSGLPDISDPATYEKLSCSVCKSMAKSVRENILREPKISTSEKKQAEFIDGLCEKLAEQHGIYRPERLNNPTPDEDKRPDKGYWVNAFYISRCSEVLADKEEYMFANYEKDETEYVVNMCPHCFKEELKAAEEYQKRKDRGEM